MKRKYIGITLVFLTVYVMADKSEAKETLDLKEYEWRNRLLLLFTSSVDGPGYLELNKDPSRKEGEVMDLDLLVFHILESGGTTLGNLPLAEGSGDDLREKFSVRPGTFTVLLIGKDGGVKLRREGQLKLQEIFSNIDSMPMRQREIERSRNRGSNQ
jgi:hypothetical protein